MPKPQYGYQHQVDRRNAMATFVNGTLCLICHRPMYVWQSLDLNHVVPVAFGGGVGRKVLTHSKCNRSEGSRIRSARRKGMARIKVGTTRMSIPKDGRMARMPRRELPKWLR